MAITDDYTKKQWGAGDQLLASDITAMSQTLDTLQNYMVTVSTITLPEINNTVNSTVQLVNQLQQHMTVVDVPEGETVTQYVDQAIADLVDGAPETIDTIKQVADAIAENGSTIDALDQLVTTNRVAIEQANSTIATISADVEQLHTTTAKQDDVDLKFAQIEAKIPDHSLFVLDSTYQAQKQTFAIANDVQAELATKQPVGDYALMENLECLATTEFVNQQLATKQPVGEYALVTDLSDFVTTAQVASGLAGKQDKGDYALKSELSPLATTSYVDQQLATKQPVGDYALSSDLSNLVDNETLIVKLDQKQDKGNYATVDQIPDISHLATQSFVTNGLSGKQDKGDYALKSDLTSLATTEYVNVKLAGKQTIGNYALKDDLVDLVSEDQLTEVLQTKQDKGDYALKNDLTTLASIVFVNQLLEGKQPVGDYALSSDLTELVDNQTLTFELDQKQDKGDYALKSDLNDVVHTDLLIDELSKKQDKGDYPVRSELDKFVVNDTFTTALAGKQDKGDYALKSELSLLATTSYVDQQLATKQPVGDYITSDQLTTTNSAVESLEDFKTQITTVTVPQINANVSALTDDIQSLETQLARVDVPSNQTVTQYVDQAIADLVDGAPETIDTINEVAVAIAENDDAITAINQLVTVNKNAIDQLIATSAKQSDVDQRFKAVQTMIPDISDLVDTGTFDAALQSKQDVGDYALKSDLSTLATTDFVNEELTKKQDVGDYVTTDALTSALKGKQDVGNYATVDQIPDVSNFVDDQQLLQLTNRVLTVEQTSGTIFALQSKVEQLVSQLQTIKTPDVAPVQVSQDAAEVSQPDSNVSFNAQTVSGIIGKIDAKSITSTDASIESGRLIVNATEDVSVNKFATTGNLEKSVANAGLTVNSGQYVNITSGDWKQTGYNAIEVGLESAPKSVLIDGVDFSVPMSNNAISIFNWKPNAVITISNCHFADVSNPIRISNRDGANATVNIVNCTCDKWDVNQPQYAGMVCFQDYTSRSAEDAVSANQFGKDKLTINLVNCYGPGNVRIEGDARQLTDNHVIYVYNEHEGLLDFDENRFPSINAR